MRLYGKIIEFYRIFGEWDFWFSRLIKLTEHILLNQPYNLLAIHLSGIEAVLSVYTTIRNININCVSNTDFRYKTSKDEHG